MTTLHRASLLALLLGTVASLQHCQPADARSGEQLAQQYCSACHLFPKPELLDRTTWVNSTLPNMATRLGVGDPNFDPNGDMGPEEIARILESGAFPAHPLITPDEWKKIVQYYSEKAPAEPLPQAARPPIAPALPGFAVQRPDFQYGKLPAVTYLGVSPKTQDLYVADRRSFLYRLRQGRLADSIPTDSPVVDIDFNGSELDALEIGIMDPNDQSKGSLWRRNETGFRLLQDQLYRPVSITRADLNQDGRDDRIICQHGNYAGRLSWYENQGKDRYVEHTLRQLPGARRAIVTDWDNDGRPDILCLFAQAREGVFLFRNAGDGKFEEKSLLEFPPVYGSSYIELADMNADGHPDLVYTNGDNADYSISLKNYHGVRIFLNDGSGNLREAWFFPVNGASKAIVSDFDQDGDPDMALISFFPDPKKNDSFLYFENKGNMTFEVSTCPEASQGRWLVACSGDIDHDGDEDIVIGSFLLKAIKEFKPDPKNPPPALLILENRLKHR